MFSNNQSKDDRVKKGDVDEYDVSYNGNKLFKRTTKGWELCILWKDGSTSWESLKDIKDSNPVELAEYAVAHEIHNEPAFRWWVHHTLRKRDRIIKKVKARMSRKNLSLG